jgi:gluconolactonase
VSGLGLEPVARGGFGLCEAPRIDGDGTVWFSDVTNGGVFRIPAGAGEIEEVVPRRRGVGGIVPHASGGVVITGRDVVHVAADGSQREVFAAPEDSGVAGFNDASTDAHGWLLVGGLRFNPMAGEAPAPGWLVVVATAFVAVAVDEGIDWPNGIGIAPGGRTAYVSDYAHGRVMAIDVDAQGALADSARPFAQPPRGSCDGLAVDVDGGVWVATGDGGALARFAPDGGLDVLEDEIAPFVSSVSFGGADGRDLLVTTAGGPDGGEVLRGRAPVAGVPVKPTVV